MADLIMEYLIPVAVIVGKIVLIVLPLLGAVAYLTYAERKVMASMQLRQGPMMVGPFGLLQPLADGLKLFSKETIFPSRSSKAVFCTCACFNLYAELGRVGGYAF